MRPNGSATAQPARPTTTSVSTVLLMKRMPLGRGPRHRRSVPVCRPEQRYEATPGTVAPSPASGVSARVWSIIQEAPYEAATASDGAPALQARDARASGADR